MDGKENLEQGEKMNSFDEYINKIEPDFKWRDTGVTQRTLLGSKVHVLNVTSLKWLDETKQSGPWGTIWSH